MNTIPLAKTTCLYMLVIKSSAELKRLRKCERVRDDDTRIMLDIESDKIKNISTHRWIANHQMRKRKQPF